MPKNLRSLKANLTLALFSALLVGCVANPPKTETVDESYIRWYQEIRNVAAPMWNSTIYEKLQIREYSPTPKKLIGERVKVEITVDPSGKILSHQILKPSKAPALNEAIKEALQSLHSLPPPPTNLVKAGQASCLWEWRME